MLCLKLFSLIIISSFQYQIGVQNNPEIQSRTNQVCETLDILKPFSFCIEISLKTADGDTLGLETWCLKRELSEKYFQQNHRMFADSETIFGHFMLLLKSTITITRIIPAYKLSMRQGVETHVMMYRIYLSEPQVSFILSKINKGATFLELSFFIDLFILRLC